MFYVQTTPEPVHILYRLDMDYVDMFLMHSARGGRVLETWDAMVQLRDEGLTK